jgi:hypothetical protein
VLGSAFYSQSVTVALAALAAGLALGLVSKEKVSR